MCTAAWRVVACRLAFIVLGVGAVATAQAAPDFLPPEQAFQFAVRAADPTHVEVAFTIAPGYYLYREQFKFAAAGARLGVVTFPAGKTKFDETFQKTVETYRDRVTLMVPVDQAGSRFKLTTTSQGCADAGLCYPPMASAAAVSLIGFGGNGSAQVIDAGDPSGLTATPNPSTSTLSITNSPSLSATAPQALSTGAIHAPEMPDTPASLDAAPATTPLSMPSTTPSSSSSLEAAPHDRWSIDAALQRGNLGLVLLVFFGAGVLLSLTPCVLPMLPIVSSIIVGQGRDVSRSRGLGLAAAYSLGMALVYTALGVAAGLAGEGLAAALQNPWMLGVFAIGLSVLALSMFDVYQLRLPASFTGRVTDVSNRLPAGRIASVAAMGGVSALIVSPCVAAPLAGALVYLSQTRDVLLGGTALFSLAIGMSVPLLLVGASAGALLPRAGVWMNDVKRIFGLLLFGVALWTVQSVVPASLVLALWGALAIGSAVVIWSGRRPVPAAASSIGTTATVRAPMPLWRSLAAALLGIVGLLQFAGAASGGTDPLQPLAHLARGAGRSASHELPMPRFATIRSVAELDTALRTAGRPVVLDFYADWCVSCKEMERFTFTDAGVQTKLAGALLLKADVTQNNADDKALLRRFNLFGPPGTIFFNARGDEIAGTRVIGFQNAARFLSTLQSAGL